LDESTESLQSTECINSTIGPRIRYSGVVPGISNTESHEIIRRPAKRVGFSYDADNNNKLPNVVNGNANGVKGRYGEVAALRRQPRRYRIRGPAMELVDHTTVEISYFIRDIFRRCATFSTLFLRSDAFISHPSLFDENGILKQEYGSCSRPDHRPDLFWWWLNGTSCEGTPTWTLGWVDGSPRSLWMHRRRCEELSSRELSGKNNVAFPADVSVIYYDQDDAPAALHEEPRVPCVMKYRQG
jgi:hypothetical protein